VVLQMSASAKINPASEARAPCPDTSDVVFPSSASPASGCHSQRRLRPDVTSDLTHIPLPSHISCSSPPLISRPDVSFPASHLRSIRTPPQGTPFSFCFQACSQQLAADFTLVIPAGVPPTTTIVHHLFVSRCFYSSMSISLLYTCLLYRFIV